MDLRAEMVYKIGILLGNLLLLPFAYLRNHRLSDVVPQVGGVIRIRLVHGICSTGILVDNEQLFVRTTPQGLEIGN